MSRTPQTPEEVLASLVSISKRMQVCTERTFDKLRATANLDLGASPEPICFPKPPSLLTPLVEAGAPRHLAQEMHAVYLDHVKKLRTHYTGVISRLRKDLPPLPTGSVDTINDQLTPLFLQLYTQSLQDWVRHEVEMFHAQRPSVHKRSFNQTFNHDYLPLLEHYFDEDPFPTQAVKATLARKSGMSYQQIHVWFQNRRSRSRRVGKVLRKKPVSEGAALPVCVDGCVTNPGKIIVDQGDPAEPQKPNLSAEPFDYCAVSSLRRSAQTELKFDPSWWLRRPSSTKPEPCSFDMDGLAEQLCRLSVRDRTSGRGKRHQDDLCYPLAATSSITVTPPPAPHPALIRKRDVSLSPLPPLVVPRTSASRSTRLQAFTTPNALSSSSLLESTVASHFPESPRKRRKVISKDSSQRKISSVCKARPTFGCRLPSLRMPQRTPYSIPCLSTNTTTDLVTPKNGSSWICPAEGLGVHSFATVRALSQNAISPWDFRFAVAV